MEKTDQINVYTENGMDGNNLNQSPELELQNENLSFNNRKEQVFSEDELSDSTYVLESDISTPEELRTSQR